LGQRLVKGDLSANMASLSKIAASSYPVGGLAGAGDNWQD
jgi:hypothetical protein